MATTPPNVQKSETAHHTDPSLGAKTTPSEAPVAAPTVLLDRANPEFLARAHAVYSGLRAQGPVVRVSIGNDFTERAQAAGSPERQAQGASGPQWLFVTRHDEAVEALLDERIVSDFRTGMTPEQRERVAASMPEEFRPIAYSLIMMDPPDHTRLRKLVQPNFTAWAMDALKPRIQRLVDELLDKAERAAAERGETAPERAGWTSSRPSPTRCRSRPSATCSASRWRINPRCRPGRSGSSSRIPCCPGPTRRLWPD